MLKVMDGPARLRIDAGLVKQLRTKGTVVLDGRRRRPRYFDGRFLAARDLTREQTYFLSRQASLGRAMGVGIIDGLMVEPGPGASAVRIAGGHGLTTDGEAVGLRGPTDVDLGDVAESERLNAAFGLLRQPAPPARSRTGLFILALRAVEFTANPIASYPTSVDGDRSLEHGDIIEASAVTLIPYPDDAAEEDPALRRSHVARKIFVEGVPPGVPAGVLPLAMLSLDRNVVQWIDNFMVRREAGADRDVLVDLGTAPRGLLSAYLSQYEQHLVEVIEERRAGNRGVRFAASEHFYALPPAGRLPAGAINPNDFTQLYFPAEVDVELGIVPEDEISLLMEDSMSLPAIDLTQSADTFESTDVLALIPAERHEIRLLAAKLGKANRSLQPATTGVYARRKPIDALRGLKRPRLASATPVPADPVDQAWRQVLSGVDFLWYVRRRNLRRNADILGEVVDVQQDEFASETALSEKLTELKLKSTFDRVSESSSTAARAELVSGLSSSIERPGSRFVLEGILHDLDEKEKVDRTMVLEATKKYTNPTVSKGFETVVATRPELVENTTVVNNLVKAGVLAEFGELIAKTTGEEQAKLLDEVERLAKKTGDAAREELAVFVKKTLGRP